MLTPNSFIRELSRLRESRQSLNLTMDQVRTMTRPDQQHHSAQPGLSAHPGQERMPPQSMPSALRPAGEYGGRNGAGGNPRSYQGAPRSPGQIAHAPGHVSSQSSSHGSHGSHQHGSNHRHTSSMDSKDGDKKEKKKKKLGLF